MKQMNKKTLKKVHVWVRAVIQLLYFLFIPSAYTAAFNGVKYIFTQMGGKESPGADFLCGYIDRSLPVYGCIRQIFLRVCLCLWKSWGCSARILCVYLQETEKETGDDESIGGKISAGSEICRAGAFGSKLLYRCIQQDTGHEPMGCIFHAACR